MYESDFAAAQAFLLSAKNFWTTSIYRQLRATYDDLQDDAPSEKTGADAAVTKLKKSITYRYFAWLERHLQRMKYTARYGIIPFHAERRDTLVNEGGFSLQDEFTPILDPNLSLPTYYRSTDIHQHQGGLWSEITAGLAYEYGARTTTPLLGETHDSLHSRFTELVSANKSFQRILDQGCGFAKSTIPFAEKFPKALISGVDLSEPCLYVAAQFAREAVRKNVKFSQQDARHTNFSDQSFDLVTSTMLLHEMPIQSIKQLFKECFRVLEPGGLMAHLDFYILPDAFSRLMHYGHSKRNNEVFMAGLVEMDLASELEAAGFTDIQLERFKENTEVDLNANDAWRFPWTSILAAKPPVQGQ